MQKLSLFTVLFAVCLRIGAAQNGYNYDRPDAALGGGNRPGQGGFQGTSGPQGGFPGAATTPTYGPPSFTQGGQAPGGGYNYPQGENDFPAAGGSSGTTGYPQRPSTGPGFSNAPTGTGAGQPYPGAQAPPAGASYPGAQVPSGSGASYPGAGQTGPQRPTGPGPQRPSTIGGGQTGFTGGPIQGQGQGAQGGQTGGFGGGSQSGGSSSGGSSSQQDESQEGDYSAIPGEPDVDYPIYSEIPETSFDCNQQEFPGYYADVEARCQVFHICALNKTFDFLCPNGTIFSQENLVCVWWNQFDCNSAPGLFGNNANLYDNTQNGQQGSGQGAQQGGQGQAQGGQQGNVGPQGPQGVAANDFVGAPGAGPTGPYPAPGRPQTQAPAFGGGATGPSGPYPAGPSGGYQPGTGAGGNYPAPGQPTGSNYPGQTGSTGSAGYTPTGPSQYPSTQGPYPSGNGAAIPPSNVPSAYQPPQGFPPQSDSPYPAAGTPQTPTRDYLPPRRG